MASGQAFRLPRENPDGTIERDTLFVNADGQVGRMTEIVLSAESPTLSEAFSDEIVQLIADGEISLSLPNQHIVNISDQLSPGQYTYLFADKAGLPKKSSSIYRVFFNGINVTDDVDVSADYMSFTFIEDYASDAFGYPDTKIIIDFTEAQE